MPCIELTTSLKAEAVLFLYSTKSRLPQCFKIDSSFQLVYWFLHLWRHQQSKPLSVGRTTSQKHEWIPVWIFLVVMAEVLNYLYFHEENVSLCGVVETFLLISLSVCFFFNKSLKDICCSPACNKCLLASRLKDLLVFWNPKWGLAREHQCFFRELFAFAFLIKSLCFTNVIGSIL